MFTLSLYNMITKEKEDGVNLKQETIDKITSALCVQVLQGIQHKLTEVAASYKERKDILMMTTSDYMVNEDKRIKDEFYAAAHTALDVVDDPDLRRLFEKELHIMIYDGIWKAVDIYYSADAWHDRIDRMATETLRDTGIWELELTYEQKQECSFCALLKFKVEQPVKYQNYIEKRDLIRKYFNDIRSKIGSLGTVETYRQFIQPLIDKGL